MLKNSAFIFAGRMAARVLGLLSTLIVARLLSPEDYGVIAACFIVQELAARMQKIGVEQNLITQGTLTAETISVAFFMRAGLGLAAALVVLALAPFAADWLLQPKIEAVLMLICWTFLFQGLSNINLVLQAKQENFAPDVWTQLSAKLIGMVLTIVLALQLNNYWALAIGIVVTDLVAVILGYIFAKPLIPRISLLNWQEIKQLFVFSRWIFLRENVDFANAQLFSIAISRLFDNKSLGMFSMGSSLSSIYASEVSAAVDRANLSHLSAKLQQAPVETRATLVMHNLNYVFDLKHLLITPVYILVAAFPEWFIRLILGENWLAMAPLLTAFLINWILIAYSYSVINLHMALRQPSIAFYNAVVQLFARIGVLLAAIWLVPSILILVYGGIVVSALGLCCLFIGLHLYLQGKQAHYLLTVALYHAAKLSLLVWLLPIYLPNGTLGVFCLLLLLILLLPLEYRLTNSQAYRDVYRMAQDGLGRMWRK